MKKKIAILGSTGSIGKSTIDILRKDKKNFDVVLLTTNNNYREILKQDIDRLSEYNQNLETMLRSKKWVKKKRNKLD